MPGTTNQLATRTTVQVRKSPLQRGGSSVGTAYRIQKGSSTIVRSRPLYAQSNTANPSKYVGVRQNPPGLLSALLSDRADRSPCRSGSIDEFVDLLLAGYSCK